MKDMLRIENLSKSFGGLAAVKSVSFQVEKGQVVSIIGPNGAGKTTVFNLLTGIYRPDSGSVYLNDRNITGLRTNEMVGAGICRTFQNIRLFSNMTVLQNVMVGYQSKLRYGLLDCALNTPRRRREDGRAFERAREILSQCGLLEQADMRADCLAYGQQRKLEIARAMVSAPEYLLLDEPAAGMNIQETADLSRFVRHLTESGFTILLIEHHMRMVMKISDYVYVMDYGEKIAEGAPLDVQKNERVIEAYIGRKGGVRHAAGD